MTGDTTILLTAPQWRIRRPPYAHRRFAPVDTELELVERTLGYLAPHFHIAREVWGTTITGTRVRLDAVLRPKQPADWKDPDVALGVEFKLLAPDSYAGARNVTRLFGQCLDYAHTTWDGYGYLFVFSYPSIIELITRRSRDIDDDDRLVFWLSRLLSRAGVGELIHNPHTGWTLLMQGHHRVWSERDGPALGRYASIARVFGSR